MGTKAITIRTEDETIAEIDGLARAMDRSRNYVVNQAMLAYVASAGAAPPEAVELSVVESAESDAEMRAIFEDLDDLIRTEPAVGDYDQKI